MDAIAERGFADELLEHADDRRTLFVGEQIEHPLGISGGVHGVLDRSGRRERVDVHRRRTQKSEVVPAAPGGAEGVGALHLHEGGEGLVEPDAVPPAHGDEVAEPHVGELVMDHVGHALQLGLGHRNGVDEQQGLAERDAAEVLHCAEGEVGHRHEVELLRRVRDAVVLAEVAQRERRRLERERGEMGVARGVHHT